MFVEYTKSKRCQCYNINNKICNIKQHKLFIYKNKRVCSLHFKILFEEIIIIIQKTYRGYKCRKLLTYFYKLLPCDVQYKIKYFMNEQLYLKKFNNNLKIVINKKLNYFINNYFNLFDKQHIGYPIYQLEQYLDNKEEIIEAYRLIIKYFELIIRPIWFNMRALWYTILDYHTNINKYSLNNNLNYTEIISKLIKIENNIKYYINTEPRFMLFI